MPGAHRFPRGWEWERGTSHGTACEEPGIQGSPRTVGAFPPCCPPSPLQCPPPPKACPRLPVSPLSTVCLSTDPDASVCPSQWVPPGPSHQQGCWERAAASMKKAPGGPPARGWDSVRRLCRTCPEGPWLGHLPPPRPPGARSFPLRSILSHAWASLPPRLPLPCSVAHEKPENPLRICTRSYWGPHPAHGKT